ncbi:MAG TPA: prolipoprotein diacylglyceryl transferase [Cyclobacteriaceae bacterium]|nr:prolipoprotein diacylglyceryl transferase [Cyclobacteriaceae bacterium]
MHPILFEAGPITIYSYGFLIALGAGLGFTYMWRQSKKEFGITFDQANTLFIILIVAGVVGGKLFMVFEDPSHYLKNPGKLISSSGFVFYGSLLFCIPTMLWFFRKNKLPVLAMLDIMAIVTCIVHGFGRLGCFMAGCCYGVPTDSWLGVIFTDPVCQAKPLNTPIHPTQLYESTFIFMLMTGLFILKARKKFDGQVFLVYLVVYAIGRSIIETFRGDIDRGFVIKDILSNSQFISLLMAATAVYFYVKLSRKVKFNI